MKKNVMFGLLVVMFISLFAYFVSGTILHVPWMGTFGTGTIELSDSPAAGGVNLSGTIKLNATNYTAYGGLNGINGSFNNNITFVKFWWINITGGQHNGHFDYWYNTSINATVVNQSTGFINSSFNTSLLADGIYSLVINVTNDTGSVNGTTLGPFTVDNFGPTVDETATSLLYNLSDDADGNTTFNVTITDILYVGMVIFYFNTNGSQFNFTSSGSEVNAGIRVIDNNSGNWGLTAFNASMMEEGEHFLTILANDTENNVNQTETIVFRVDRTAPNISELSPSDNPYYDISDGNITFSGRFADGLSTVKNVSFNFANGTGTAFNVTSTNATGGNRSSSIWNISYNVSRLCAGSHNISFLTWDYSMNFNNTRALTNVIRFTVNTAPNVTLFDSINSAHTYTVSDRNLTYNISAVNNSLYGPTAYTNLAIDNVFLQFNNGSGRPFNITATPAVSTQRYYNFSHNLFVLNAGWQIVTVFANDTNGNWNRSETFSFLLNTAPIVNITLMNVTGQNFSKKTSNQTFNLSVWNSSSYDGENYTTIDKVILMFDNASGTDFNVTMNGPHNIKNFNISYNVSSLAEGTHTVTVFANDSRGNWNRSESFTFVTDFTSPEPTLTRSSTSTTNKLVIDVSTESTTRSCGVSPGYFSSTTGSGYGAGGSRTIEYTGLSAGTAYTFTVTCTDYTGNEHTKVESFTTDSAGTSGSGTGGSGGGSSTGTKGETEQKAWASIFAGETATVDIANGEIGISQVSFDVSETVYGPTVTIAKKQNFPSSVKDFENRVYRNLRISKTPVLKDEYLNKIKIKFNVQKAWLVENGLGKDEVDLYRYVDDAWVALSAIFDGEDTDYIYYSAETPGFSYFVIGEREGPTVAEIAEEAATAAEEAAIEELVEEAVAEERATIGKGLVIFLLLVAITVVAVVIYLRRRN